MTQTIKLQGSFVSDGAAHAISLPTTAVTSFHMWNQTKYSDSSSTQFVKEAHWNINLPDGYAYVLRNTTSAATSENTLFTSLGFSFIRKNTDLLGPVVTGTAVTAAATPVATATSHGFSNGDVLQLTGTTAMLQISQFYYTIKNVMTNTFDLSFISTSGFAAAATALTARKVKFPTLFTPRQNFITAITKANPMVLTCSYAHTFAVGEIVRLRVPAAWGMTQANGLRAQVTAISTANNTVTLDVNSTAFTTFAFPTSAVAVAGTDLPQIYPDSQSGSFSPTSPVAPYDTDSLPAMVLGTGLVGATSDLIEWEAECLNYDDYA
jgi:hypothetical protein